MIITELFKDYSNSDIYIYCSTRVLQLLFLKQVEFEGFTDLHNQNPTETLPCQRFYKISKDLIVEPITGQEWELSISEFASSDKVTHIDYHRYIIDECPIIQKRFDDNIWRRLYDAEGVLVYEGYTVRLFDYNNNNNYKYKPSGVGQMYFGDGCTVYRRGLFEDNGGLLVGEEFYPDGSLRFSGMWKHHHLANYNFPVVGRFYEPDGHIAFEGTFEIDLRTSGLPIIKTPANYGSLIAKGVPSIDKYYEERIDIEGGIV